LQPLPEPSPQGFTGFRPEDVIFADYRKKVLVYLPKKKQLLVRSRVQHCT
jgi:hypothetical protein